MIRKILFATILIILIALSITACVGVANSTPVPSASPTLTQTTPKPSPKPTSTPIPTPAVTYSQYQLEYRLLANYPDYFWCDPDYYPVGRPGVEQINAIQQLTAIQANAAEFSAILEQLNLPNKTDYTDDEKLNIYREHKKLTYAVTVIPSGNIYNFSLRVGKNQGQHITGTITPASIIMVTTTETSFNTCPICLTQGTLIDTPSGTVPVEQLQPGMLVWTIGAVGKRVAAPILKTCQIPVPSGFQVVRIELNNVRIVTASPGHPSADMRPLGDYRIGDMLDGDVVTGVERLDYAGGATFDLLPAGKTGLYWANGILLGSTLTN